MFIQNLFNSITKLLKFSLLNSLDQYLILKSLQIDFNNISFLDILTSTAQLNSLHQLLPVYFEILELVFLDEGVEGDFQRRRHFVYQVR